MRAITLSNMNIFETSGSVVIKGYLKHQWGGEKPALGFGADRIRTLVSMAYGHNGENCVSTFSRLF